MNNIDLTNYCDHLIANPKTFVGNSKEIDYDKRLIALIQVIQDLANAIEYGTAINTFQKLNAVDKLIIHQNILPYFTQSRAKYSDVLLLSLRKNNESDASVLPLDIIRHILMLKSRLGFISCQNLINKYFNNK